MGWKREGKAREVGREESVGERRRRERGERRKVGDRVTRTEPSVKLPGLDHK